MALAEWMYQWIGIGVCLILNIFFFLNSMMNNNNNLIVPGALENWLLIYWFLFVFFVWFWEMCVVVCFLWQVRELETDPLFNSGRGSALTEKGTVEMEASIMDGPKRRCGAVSGVTTVKNPISLARLVMDKSPHSYLAFDGAEEFARQQVRINSHVFLTPISPLFF